MPNRREFLQTGAAVSAIAANGVLARAAHAVGARRAVPVRCAVYDDRYAEGRRFAAVVGAQGIAPRALDDGDITRVWHELLEGLWSREPSGVAGFTQFGPMFVVERLAAERGMRVELRVLHRAAPDGTLEHVVSARRETLELARALEPLSSDWPAVMAALACSVCGDDPEWRTVELATPGLYAPRLPPSAATQPPFVHYYTPHAEQQGYGAPIDGPLYSWVVAPPAQRG
jgi:hypothetical protein